MKNLKRMAMMALFLILAVASVKAQTGRRIEASIPFDFAAGKTNLKAGDYTVRRISRNVLLLRTADNKTSVLLQAAVRIPPPRSEFPTKLVFTESGGRYFLTEIWADINGDGMQLGATRTESLIARESGGAARPQRVEIALRTK